MKQEQVKEVDEGYTYLAEGENWRRFYFSPIAKKLGDKNICKNIVDTDFMHDKCLYDVDCEIGDVGICEYFDEKTDSYDNADMNWCFMCVARKNKDASLYERVTEHRELKADCWIGTEG